MRFTRQREEEVRARILENPKRCITFPELAYREDGSILIHRDGLSQFLHRYLYKEMVGPVAKGQFLLKICATDGCVNPTEGHRLISTRPTLSTTTRATECPNGHQYTKENTRLDSRGWRVCVTCHENELERRRQLRRGENPEPGKTIADVNRAKTHCPQGHEYTPENTYVSYNHRACRTCKIARSRKRRADQRKTAAPVSVLTDQKETA